MKVIFEIQGGSPVEMECNAGENLLEVARHIPSAITRIFPFWGFWMDCLIFATVPTE